MIICSANGAEPRYFIGFYFASQVDKFGLAPHQSCGSVPDCGRCESALIFLIIWGKILEIRGCRIL
ncbi:MAG: hypothetical protein A3J93_05340 [Candidatus Magasanikbacteria bacterium RIFOXYC2_FULL_42_28]|uniref:Uncharacterized protein n=1 Tax=Candidatus Magasanikbacteria bacterium RIFOXYC2_FULL_42_28 TaxID=1798704 RepID=A0A1F6NV64_9BACT|nr:MAG: hypothetical protein A3J93_05340 [Candidatus Magasanikbacteria bacterium RIFOXYC2_FULL_42_28]